MSHYYSEIYLHYTWHCKGSTHMIKPNTEAQIYDLIRRKCLETPRARVHELGGTTNHMHLVVSVPPLDIGRWIGAVKGASSHDINATMPVFDGAFAWQTGYGLVTFGKKDLAWVVKYVQEQKTHHLNGTWYERLERFSEEDEC